MNRRTNKYTRALVAARERHLSQRGSAQALYERLRKAGLQWDPEMGPDGGWFVAAERFDPRRIRQVKAAARARAGKRNAGERATCRDCGEQHLPGPCPGDQPGPPASAGLDSKRRRGPKRANTSPVSHEGGATWSQAHMRWICPCGEPDCERELELDYLDGVPRPPIGARLDAVESRFAKVEDKVDDLGTLLRALAGMLHSIVAELKVHSSGKLLHADDAALSKLFGVKVQS